jgi:hypothetical protein
MFTPDPSPTGEGGQSGGDNNGGGGFESEGD